MRFGAWFIHDFHRAGHDALSCAPPISTSCVRSDGSRWPLAAHEAKRMERSGTWDVTKEIRPSFQDRSGTSGSHGAQSIAYYPKAIHAKH